LSKHVAVKLAVKNFAQDRIRLSILRTSYQYRGFESPLSATQSALPRILRW
jgi:hypothetical protein